MSCHNDGKSKAIVRILDVHKSFGNAEVLKGVSLAVEKGETICIIGPSGSGKSTLLRCINALVPISRGEIYVGDIGVQELKSDKEKLALRKSVSMVFQQFNLFPHKTVLENVVIAPMHVLGRKKEDAIEQAHRLLNRVGLDEKASTYPGELSGGQQQRVAIARSLAMNPSVMLFDEVTSALDPETVKGVLNTIGELTKEGMTCILVTHEMGFAREVADCVYFTDGGKIVEQGPPAQVFSNPKDHRTCEFLGQVL